MTKTTVSTRLSNDQYSAFRRYAASKFNGAKGPNYSDCLRHIVTVFFESQSRSDELTELEERLFNRISAAEKQIISDLKAEVFECEG